MSQEAESRLIERCRQGESAAWDELFNAHYAAAARFIFQLGNDFSREDVEEICQEAFLSVIRKIGSFQGGCQFQTWLFRIAANRAGDFRERRQAAKRGAGHAPLSLQAEDPVTGLTPDPASPLPAPDLLLLRAEQADLVHNSLDQLGQPCREIIELRYFAELSYEEISQVLQLNAKTVSSRLSKCLDQLEIVVRQTFSGENLPVFPSNS
jgi:RNA polymerase sigma-70 factor (ECF subfamily)